MTSRFAYVALSILAVVCLVLGPDAAQAGRGGGRGGGGGGGGFRPSGGGGFGGGSFQGGNFGGGNRGASAGFERAGGGFNRPDSGFRPDGNGFRGGEGSRSLDSFSRPNAGGLERPDFERLNSRGPANSAEVSDFLGLPRDHAGLAPERNPLAGNDRSWARGYSGTRASWSNLSPDRIDHFNDRMHDVVRPTSDRPESIHNWNESHPQRAQDWKHAGDQVRNRWADQNRPGSDAWRYDHRNDNRDHRPGDDWWSKNHPDLHPWYYHHGWHNHDWNYWWGVSPWSNVNPWFGAWGWTQPVYYDYGAGGNVVYQDNSVYVNGQNVGTAEEYAESAANLATVDPAVQSPADNDWLPLGTFSFVTSANDPNANRILQLAVDKQGIISGTLHNDSTDKSYVVQGRVDRDTQRVAFTIGSNSDVVVETGIYNLTQEQTPVLVHYGDDRTEQYLLVRLGAPPQPDDTAPIEPSQVDPLTEPATPLE